MHLCLTGLPLVQVTPKSGRHSDTDADHSSSDDQGSGGLLCTFRNNGDVNVNLELLLLFLFIQGCHSKLVPQRFAFLMQRALPVQPA